MKNSLLKQTGLDYQGFIFDMGLKDVNGMPTFYLTTMENKDICVPLDSGENIASCNLFMKSLGTEITDIEFKDFRQYWNLVDEVFYEYLSANGKKKMFYFDNTLLNKVKKEYHISDAELARKSNLGASTVNDLTRGVTKHPTLFTMAGITMTLNELTA